jgi:hypothetical protein
MRSWQSRSTALRALPAVFGCIALVSVASEARSQAAINQYAAKYVCGIATGATVAAGIVAPGKYFTSINVHNPNNVTTEFQKTFDIALPNEDPEGKRSTEPVTAQLPPNGAFEIECADILKHLAVSQPFVKGFVTLRSPAALDVVAVYTAAASPSGGVAAMFMERVPKGP